ncbi:HBS1-like protein isoform X4 [Ptychodera flava]|uniref:HBS1-like protein isoform X4 n=1 Tax=Ptychodera flava TaxID=63121 RepID=UPI003969D9DE
MSRHRNIRNKNYDDEYAGYDDVYGHSVEDDSYCVSPATAEQFLFQRSHHEHNLSSFMREESINEEEEESDDETPLNDSRNYQRPILNPIDEAKLQSCLEEIRNIVGETVPEHIIIDSVLHFNFNYERALDAILNQNEPPRKSSKNASKSEKQGITSRNEATAVVDTSTEEQTIQGVARLSFPPTRESDTGAIKKTSRDELDKNGLPSFAEPTGEVVVGATSFADSPSTSASTTPSMPRVASKAKLPTIDVMAEYEKRQGTGKDLINLVVIGHVDAGKSTLMGHLLFLLGNVNKRTMHKYEQESKKAGKASFAYAWVLDETGEERERGITMDVGLTNFETTKKIVTLLDAPGHKDFIPNMITGAAQADVAILVVDASRGEFEAGFDSGGQTREHAMLVRSLGVTQLVVAVNKLDNVDWSQERYSEIVAKLGHFLKQAGFKDSEVAYIPCSGLTGENLVEHPKEARLKMWYNKHTLVEQIDKFKPPKRPIDKPFRLCVSDVFKGMGSGFSVSGKIVSGNIQAGDRILVKPAGEQGNIKTVLVQDEDTKWACAGDHVTLTVTGIDQMRVNVGSMLCSPSEPIKATTKVNARVIIFNIDVPITRGYPVVFHYQTLSEPATIKKLISLLNKSTGEVIKKKPRCLVKQSNATICIETARPVCVELYKDYKDLGRFMLRSGGSTIAAGVITEIL